MRHPRTLLVAVLAAALLAPATALAGAREDYLDVYKAYTASGKVDACKFSAAKLASAKKGVPPDLETYAPDFPDALDAALRQRAGGSCDGEAAAGTTPKRTTSTGGSTSAPAAAAVPPAGSTPPATAATGTTGATAAAGITPAPAAEPAAAAGAADGSVSAAAARDAQATGTDDAPFALVLLAVLAGLALLAGLLWAVVRFFAWDPPWLVAGRHATAEAGWRASASWAEFSDWLRLGR